MLNNILKWTGAATSLTGALCTSLRILPFNFMLLTFGGILYIIWALRIKEWNLVVVNLGFLAIYVFGLFWQ